MLHILIVEDNPDYRELLQNFLESANYLVTASIDGADALTLIKQYKFDLILLDIMLPKIDGYGVCEIIRKESNIPIIMLTALDSETHQVCGFDLCIDDYIIKPVSMKILLHKVEAVLRRTSLANADTYKLSYKNILLDIKTYTVYVSGVKYDFTLREFEILHELLHKPCEVVSRKSLLKKLWEYDYYGDVRIIDTHIKNIRKKLGESDCIETVRGVGYKLQETDCQQFDS